MERPLKAILDSGEDDVYRRSLSLLREHQMVGNQTSAEGRMVKTIMNEVSDGNEEQDGRGNATLPINWQII